MLTTLLFKMPALVLSDSRGHTALDIDTHISQTGCDFLQEQPDREKIQQDIRQLPDAEHWYDITRRE